MLVVEKWKLLSLAAVLTISVTILLGVYINFPKLYQHEKKHMKLPRCVEDAKHLGRILLRYRERHYFAVLGAVLVVYIFLQSFAIPGSIFLTILSGYLFSFPVALLLVCTCSACGASICYFLSYLLGKSVVNKYWPDRVLKWKSQISHHREHLLNYMIFLRVTPFLPNWFINIASPVISVPFGTFFWGTFLGVAPPSFVFIQAGTTLEEMTNTGAAWSWLSIILLAVFAILSLMPVLFKKALQKKLE